MPFLNGKPHVKRGLTPGWLASPWSNCPWVHDLYYYANNSRFEFSKDFAPFESIWGVSQTATFQSNVLPSDVGIQNVWMCFKKWKTQYDISQMFHEIRFPNNVSSSVPSKRTIEDLEPNDCNVLLEKSQETYYSKSLLRVSCGIFPWDPHSPSHGIEAWAAAVGHLGCRKSLRRDPGEDGGDGAGLITSQWMAGLNYFLWFITWYLYTVWKTWISPTEGLTQRLPFWNVQPMKVQSFWGWGGEFLVGKNREPKRWDGHCFKQLAQRRDGQFGISDFALKL